MATIPSRSARWALALGLVLVTVSVPWASAQQKRQTLFTGPYQQLQMAYANGFVEGVKYVTNQVLVAKMKPAQLKDLAGNKGDVLKALVTAQAKQYADKLAKLNSAKSKTQKK